MTKTISAYVGERMLEVVDRLFRGDLTSVIKELAQNARRSGAGKFEITSASTGPSARLTVFSDGEPLADPAVLLGLRDSAWTRPDVADEDPAGMGFFVLSGRPHVVAESADWRVELCPAVFLGKESAEVETGRPKVAGMRISFACTLAELAAMDLSRRHGELSTFLAFCGLEVWLDGKPIARQDFLGARTDKVFVLDCADLGARASVTRLDTPCHSSSTSARFNFHGFCGGVILPAGFLGGMFSVAIDIQHARQIKPVLPARKELSQNEAVADLIRRIEVFGYTVLSRHNHALAYERYQRACELGVSLPEASPSLWRASSGNPIHHFQWIYGDIVDFDKSVVLESCPVRYACVTWELLKVVCGKVDVRLPRRIFDGYSWYDQLPRASVMQAVNGVVLCDDDDTLGDDEREALAQAGLTIDTWDGFDMPEVGDCLAVCLIEGVSGWSVRLVPIDAVVCDSDGLDPDYREPLICVSSTADVEDVRSYLSAVWEDAFTDCDDAADAYEQWEASMTADIEKRLQTPEQATVSALRRISRRFSALFWDPGVDKARAVSVRARRTLTGPSTAEIGTEWREHGEDKGEGEYDVEIATTVTKTVTVRAASKSAAIAAVRSLPRPAIDSSWEAGTVTEIGVYAAGSSWKSIHTSDL